MRRLSNLLPLALTLAPGVVAQVRMPRIFTDHMVLQQQLPIAVWGYARPGENVEVTFANASRSTAADDTGRWRVDLPAMPADGERHRLLVRASNEVAFEDVVLGEVWLCAGQSNMNREVRIEDEDPDIRLFWIDASVVPRRDDLGESVAGWVPSTPTYVAAATPTLRRGKPTQRTGFAEVGYVFGRRIHGELGVPVGLIKCAFGGSQVRAWVPDETLPERVPFGTAATGKYLGHRPGLLYRSMVHGMVPFTVRGVLWYQGENDGRDQHYADQLVDWVRTWRELWSRPTMPFYLVQIAPTSYAGGRMQFIWEAQCDAVARVGHAGLAVSNDIYLHGKRPESEVVGEDGRLSSAMRPSNPHPPNKHIVGERLANLALAGTYGRDRGVVHGPQLDSYVVDGDSIVVKLTHAGDGLRTRDGESPRWFELSDGSRDAKRRLIFHPATARITSPDTITVHATNVAAPKWVRFAWHCTAIHNLVNSAGLPAVAFRTDREAR